MPSFLVKLVRSFDHNLFRHLRPSQEVKDRLPHDQLQTNGIGLALTVALGVLYFLVLPILLTLLLKALVSPLPENQLGFYTVAIQVVAGVLFLLIAVVALPITKWFPSWRKPTIVWQKVGLYFAIMLSFNFIWAIFYTALGVTSSSDNQSLINSLVLEAPILMGIAVVILAPLVEELLFRYFLFGFFTRYRTWIAILISSLAFGLIHVIDSFADNWMFIFQYATMGAVIAWSYVDHKRLVYPIALHGMNNLFSFIVMLIISLIQQFIP